MPILKIPMSAKHQYILNPVKAVRDQASIARGAVNPFLTRRDMVQKSMDASLTNPFNDLIIGFEDEFVPQRGTNYYMHIDLGTEKNAAGVAMCHVVDFKTVKREVKINNQYEVTTRKYPIIQFDFVGNISPAEIGESILISDIRDLVIYELNKRGFFLKLITFDNWQSTQTIQDLRREGFTIDRLSLDRTTYYPVVDYTKEDNIKRESTDMQYMSAWESLRDAIYEGRLIIPYHREYLKQCRRAQEVVKGSRRKVESNISGYTLDMLESIAGSIYNASNNEMPGFESSIEKDSQYMKMQGAEDRFYEGLVNDNKDLENDEINDIYEDLDSII